MEKNSLFELIFDVARGKPPLGIAMERLQDPYDIKRFFVGYVEWNGGYSTLTGRHLSSPQERTKENYFRIAMKNVLDRADTPLGSRQLLSRWKSALSDVTAQTTLADIEQRHEDSRLYDPPPSI
jgi:hypothetical protein